MLFHLMQAVIKKKKKKNFCSELRAVLGCPGWKRCQTGPVRASMLKKGSDLAGCQSDIFQQPEEIEENKIEMQLPALLTLAAPCSCNSFAENRGEMGRKQPDGTAHALIFPLLQDNSCIQLWGRWGRSRLLAKAGL